MKRILKLTVLTAALAVTLWPATGATDGTCESIQGKACQPRGLLMPCTFADGSPGLCTCVGRWDCLV